MRTTTLLVLGLALNSLAADEEDYGSGSLEDRLDWLTRAVLKPELECGLWTGIFRLMNQGNRTKEFYCERNFLEMALRVDESNLVAVVWLTQFHADRLDERTRADLLARLTTLPFWLDQGGLFWRPFSKKEKVMDHWSEDNQIVWLVGSYFIGDNFQRTLNASDVIFSSSDQTGIILKREAKQKLWRWLDQRQRFGFTHISSNSVSALITLAAASEDKELKKLAAMTLYLHIWELKRIHWKEDIFLSSKVKHGDRKSLSSLLWLLTGTGSPSLTSQDTLLLAMSLRLNFALPDLLKEAQNEETGQQITTFSYGASASDINIQNKEDCLILIGQDGPYGSLSCYNQLGDDFRLWGRHPMWKHGIVKDFPAQFLPIMSRSFPMTERTREMIVQTDILALVSRRKGIPGTLASPNDDSFWKLLTPLGTTFLAKQSVGDSELVPFLAQHNTTIFIINNPWMVVSSIFNTGKTTATTDMEFDKVFSRDSHWLIAQTSRLQLSVYSDNAINWKELMNRPTRDPQTTHNVSMDIVWTSVDSRVCSQNVWIVHAEPITDQGTLSKNKKDDNFQQFVTRILNTPLDVQRSFEDTFRECLHQCHCLDHGSLRFWKCLRADCPLKKYVEISPVAKCLGDSLDSPNGSSFGPEAVSMMGMTKMAACLSKPLADITLKWQLGRNVYQFGSGQDLTVWEDNEVVANNTQINWQYNAPPAALKIPLGAKKMKLGSAASNRTLELNFEDIRFTETN